MDLLDLLLLTANKDGDGDDEALMIIAAVVIHASNDNHHRSMPLSTPLPELPLAPSKPPRRYTMDRVIS
jgi:hypothetical protein